MGLTPPQIRPDFPLHWGESKINLLARAIYVTLEEGLVSTVLLIGSTEPYSGKSAVILGLAHQLQQRGIPLAYGRPLDPFKPAEARTEAQEPTTEFMTELLNLPASAVSPTVLQLDPAALLAQMQQPQSRDHLQPLNDYIQQTPAELVLLEGPSDMQEGRLFQLSLPEMAERLQASVLLINRYHSVLTIDTLLESKARLGERLMGVIISEVPDREVNSINTIVTPFAESHGIPILGVMGVDPILRSISVGELVYHLSAEVLCCPDRMDLMVEDFAIGAMNVNSALKYFRKSNHKAVITGGDRTDIQLAALETSTLCLILTGKLPLDPRIQARAEELEVPVLSVDLDTFTTSERIEHMFGQIRLHDTVKVERVKQLMSENVDFDRLFKALELTQSLVSPAS